jgi:hypothetical protein
VHVKVRRALATLFVVLLASCSSLLGVDEYNSSTDDLCELLVACYGFPACEQHIGQSLDAASSTDRTAWLVAFSDEGCMLKCTSARKCLDIDPVCESEGESCAVPEECCGFLTGEASCNQKCCRPPGVPCEVSSPEDVQGNCCEGECSRTTGTCGGTVCYGVGQFCLNDLDCCTKACRDFKCAENLCGLDGDPCEDPIAPCCDGLCGPNNRCGCTAQGGSCVTDNDCCKDPNLPPLQCQPETQTCEPTTTCIPNELPCGPLGCCSGFCDDQSGTCADACTDVAAPCQKNEECCTGECVNNACACSTEICTKDTDCCEVTPGANDGKCYGGACHPVCVTSTCDHGECATGGPLSDACTTSSLDPTCIPTVCALDPYCCCNAWDEYCIDEAVELCNNVCG